jgi:hypothetical protein
MKVRCYDCKHADIEQLRSGCILSADCKLTKKKHKEWEPIKGSYTYTIIEECEKKNKEGTCKDFTPATWWQKLFR